MHGTLEMRADDLWALFLAWLEGAASGVSPAWQREAFGALAPQVKPRARQIAPRVAPWLLEILERRRRQRMRGLDTCTSGGSPVGAGPGLRAEDALMAPLTEAELASANDRKGWALDQKLWRLLRLLEADAWAVQRPGWPTWEVRYWQVAVALLRLGQRYGALERAKGDLEAQRIYQAAARRGCRRASEVPQAAA